MDGEAQTGITIMYMVKKLDAGNINFSKGHRHLKMMIM
ncbi:hypothetical protein [Streptococcus pneumoniae]